MQRLRQAAVRPADDRPGPPVALTRALLAALLVTGCSTPAAPSAVEGQSSAAPGRPCAPASPLASAPPLAAGLVLPPGAVVTAYDGGVVTGRTGAAVSDVLDHFRTSLERAGYVLQRDEDEGRAGELGFFGARADGTVTVARLTCPRGETGFTVVVRAA